MSASTSLRPTRSDRLPLVLAEYKIAERAEELARASARLAERSRAASRRPTGPAMWPGAWAQVPNSRPSARSGSPTCATATRCSPAACSRAESTFFSSRPVYDLLQAKAAIQAARRAMAQVGREVADPGAGDDRAHRPDAARNRGRGRPLLARGDEARRDRHELCHGPGRDVRSAAPPLRPGTPVDLGAAQRRAAIGRRRQDALRPDAGRPRRAPVGVRHRARRLDRRWLLRHDARTPGEGRASMRRISSRRPARPCYEPSAASLYTSVAVRTGALVPRHRRADERQRLEALPRRDARRRLGDDASPWPATRHARAPTSSTSASTTPAPTESAT